MRVLAGRFDGIGTRLLTFMAGRYFAESVGAPIEFLWPSLNDPLYKEKSLLSASSSREIFLDGMPFKDLPQVYLSDWEEVISGRLIKLHERPWSHSHTKGLLLDGISDFDVLLYDLPYAIDDTGAESAREKFLQYWKCFNFHPSILQAREEVVQQYADEPYLAVHLRRGDTAQMLSESPIDFLVEHGFEQLFQRYLTFDQAVNLIEEHYEVTLPIVVVSEDAAMPTKLAHAMPRRRISGTTGIFEHGGTKQALLDLLVLSGSDCLLSPACSFFSECAVKVGRTANLKAPFDFEYISRELFPLLEAHGGDDVRLRKGLFYEAGHRTTLSGSAGKERLLAAAKQYLRRAG